jgi:hypothetical protein
LRSRIGSTGLMDTKGGKTGDSRALPAA